MGGQKLPVAILIDCAVESVAICHKVSAAPSPGIHSFHHDWSSFALLSLNPTPYHSPDDNHMGSLDGYNVAARLHGMVVASYKAF